MDDPFQQQALGRANAACAAIFSIFDYFQNDIRMAVLFEQHMESARALLLNTRTPEIALNEFEKAIEEMRKRLPKNHAHP